MIVDEASDATPAKMDYALDRSVAGLVERLAQRAKTMNGASPVGAGDGHTYTLGYYDQFAAKDDREAASLIQSQAAEIARCHARLEIDHHFVLNTDRPTDTVDDLVRVEVPMADRADQIDGIECRDATIKEQDRLLDSMRARIAELEAGLEPFAREADDWPPETPDHIVAGDYENITVGHLRTARSLLNKERNG